MRVCCIPATTRSVLMYLAQRRAFRPLWSDLVHTEWTTALLRNRRDLNPDSVARTRALLEAHVHDANVVGYEHMISTLALPDPNDRHVLAAAIHGEANVIVTVNLGDFPSPALAPYNLVAQHPDIFITGLLDADPQAAVSAFAADRAAMKNPHMTPDQYLAGLDRAGLCAAAAALRAYIRDL